VLPTFNQCPGSDVNALGWGSPPVTIPKKELRLLSHPLVQQHSVATNFQELTACHIRTPTEEFC